MRAALVSLLFTGCFSFAPPVQSTHYGAPAQANPDQVELSGVAGAVSVGQLSPDRGSAGIAVPISDSVKLELGAQGSRFGFGLGTAGLRYTNCPVSKERWCLFAADFELGLGAGRVAAESFAYGAYGGYGLGYSPLPWLSVFARARGQLSGATEAPFTAWGSALGGLALKTAHLSGFIGGGYAGLSNSLGSLHAPLWEVGLSYHTRVGFLKARRSAW